MLDPAFLAEAGWDPGRRVLSLPAGHRLLGRAVCRVGGCATTAQPGWLACALLLHPADRAGAETGQIARAPQLPPLPAAAGCAVPGMPGDVPRCRRRSCVSRMPGSSAAGSRTPAMEQFLADPRVRPLLPLGPCAGGGVHPRRRRCSRLCATPTISGGGPSPGPIRIGTRAGWQLTDGAVAEGGQVSLRGLPPLVVVQVLFGIWQRTRSGAKITDVALRASMPGAAPPAGHLDRGM